MAGAGLPRAAELAGPALSQLQQGAGRGRERRDKWHWAQLVSRSNLAGGWGQGGPGCGRRCAQALTPPPSRPGQAGRVTAQSRGEHFPGPERLS